MDEQVSYTLSTSESTSFPTLSTSTIVTTYPLEQNNTGGEILTPDSPGTYQVLADLEFEGALDPLEDISTSIMPIDELLFEFDNQSEGEAKENNARADQHLHSEKQYVEQSKGKKSVNNENESEPEQTCSRDYEHLHDSRGKKSTSERSRRKRINGKVKALQELIPNCYKRDEASILEDAVKYIQSLKLQLDILSFRQTQLQGLYAARANMALIMRAKFGQLQMGLQSGYASMVPPYVQFPPLPQASAQAQVVGQSVLCPPVPSVQVSLPFLPAQWQSAPGCSDQPPTSQPPRSW